MTKGPFLDLNTHKKLVPEQLLKGTRDLRISLPSIDDGHILTRVERRQRHKPSILLSIVSKPCPSLAQMPGIVLFV